MLLKITIILMFFVTLSLAKFQIKKNVVFISFFIRTSMHKFSVLLEIDITNFLFFSPPYCLSQMPHRAFCCREAITLHTARSTPESECQKLKIKQANSAVNVFPYTRAQNLKQLMYLILQTRLGYDTLFRFYLMLKLDSNFSNTLYIRIIFAILYLIYVCES